MGLHMRPIQEKSINKQRRQEEQFFCEDVLSENDESSMMISNDVPDQSSISKLQEQIQELQKEKESLKIDNVCLKQKNNELENRIDDVATRFPKTSILLGKKPNKSKWKKGFSIKLKKRK